MQVTAGETADHHHDDHDHQHHSHDHDHAHSHSHGHEHHKGLKGWLFELFVPHSHDAADSVDDALEASAEGIRALKISSSLLGNDRPAVFGGPGERFRRFAGRHDP